MSKGKVFRAWNTNKKILHVMRKENMEEIKGTGGRSSFWKSGSSYLLDLGKKRNKRYRLRS